MTAGSLMNPSTRIAPPQREHMGVDFYGERRAVNSPTQGNCVTTS